MLNNNQIAISYSLPELSMEKSDSDSINISYYNEPALVIRNLNTLMPDSIISFDFKIEKNDFFYQHFTFTPYANKIIFPCNKFTWPIEIALADYKGKPNLDPFGEAFYHTDNPVLSIFSQSSGKLQKRFGHIEEPQRLSRTGNFYRDIISSVCGNEIVYGNGPMGQLHIVNGNDLDKELENYNVFSVDCNSFPPLDTAKFYTYEYTKPYEKFLTRNIQNVKLTPTHVYCIVKYGAKYYATDTPDDRYTFISIDRKSGLKVEKLLPAFPGMKVFGYGLRNFKDTYQPFVFFMNNNNIIVRVFR